MAPDEILGEEKLSPRQRDILRTLIQEYIASVLPVGSNTLQELSNLGVSSATIRNEMVLLEQLGYVAQPHTSAGRVPTAKGYRYFVEQLMEQVDLPVPEQLMIRHQFYQIRLDLEQWMRLTAAVLARTSRAAAMVTPPRAVNSRFKHMELISLSDVLCLMVLVLQDNSIHQEILELESPNDQATLSQTSNKLNALLQNQAVEDIEGNVHPDLAALQTWEAQVLERVLDVMQQADEHAITEIYHDGLVHVMQQPEFVDSAKLRQVIAILEQRGLLESILAKILNANGVQIIIGGEGPYEDIYDVSMVLSPYGVKGQASGVLGVMGPTRMPYARVISAVRYVARIMDSLISDVYGAQL